MRRTPSRRPFPVAATLFLGGLVAFSPAAPAQEQAPAVLAPPTAAPDVATPATTQSAPDKVNEVAEALAARKEREEQLKALPAVQVKSLREVVQFAIEKDDVVLRTSIPPTEMAAVI